MPPAAAGEGMRRRSESAAVEPRGSSAAEVRSSRDRSNIVPVTALERGIESAPYPKPGRERQTCRYFRVLGLRWLFVLSAEVRIFTTELPMLMIISFPSLFTITDSLPRTSTSVSPKVPA